MLLQYKTKKKLTGVCGIPKSGCLHCKKNLETFQSPAGMSLTKLSDIPAGEGNVANLFLRCMKVGIFSVTNKVLVSKIVSILFLLKNKYIFLSYSWN
jgi:hypothetical protein